MPADAAVLEVVSVSLGSPARDWEALVTVGGERFLVRRVGTAGDLRRAAALLRALDGRVAALGLGGVNRALLLGDRAYPLPAGQWLAAQVRRSPVCDGARWKAVVEPAAVRALVRGGLALAGRTAVVASLLDRPALGDALAAVGCRVLVGDAYYALGLPVWFSSRRGFALAARCLLPALRRLPLRWLYPLGAEQERAGSGFARLFRGVDLLAGDFHLLRRRLPASLAGKAVIASTLTPADLRLLRQRGVARVSSLAPLVGGRALAGNVWEAMAAAACGRPPERLGDGELVAFWQEAGGACLDCGAADN